MPKQIKGGKSPMSKGGVSSPAGQEGAMKGVSERKGPGPFGKGKGMVRSS